MGKQSVSMDNMIELAGAKWFLDYKSSTLYEADLEGLTIKPRALLSKGDYKDYPKVYGSILAANGRIFAIPEAPIPIAVYDPEKQKATYIEYKMDFEGFPGKIFAGAVQKDRFVYLIPCCYGSIVKIDVFTEELSYYPLQDFYYNGAEPAFLFDGFIEKKDGFWFSTYKGNKVLSFDYETGHTVLECELPQENAICGLTGNQDVFYIIPIKAEKIYKYSAKDKKLCEMEIFPADYEAGKWSFSRIITEGDRSYLLPRDANGLCIMENETIVKMIKKETGKAADYFDKYFYFSNAFRWNNRLFVFGGTDGDFAIYNEDYTLDKVSRFSVSVSECDTSYRDLNEMIKETRTWNVEWFIEELLNSDKRN